MVKICCDFGVSVTAKGRYPRYVCIGGIVRFCMSASEQPKGLTKPFRKICLTLAGNMPFT